MDQIKTPGPLGFEGNLSENWRRWLQRFHIFLQASGRDEKSDAVQASTLLHVAGEEAIDIYNTFQWAAAGDDKKMGKIIDKFEAYCNPRKNITWERHVFNTRKQLPSETIDHYVTDLRNKARSCEFENLTDGLIRDRIVCGIVDDQVRARLLREKDLTLQKAVDICRASDASASQIKLISGDTHGSEAAEVHAVRKQQNQGARPKSQYSSASGFNKKAGSCYNCGGGHGRKEQCPAIGATCHYCKRQNHFASVCFSK